MVDSIHAARWASQFDPREVQFTLFPSGPNRRVHPIFKELGLPIIPFGGLLSVPLWIADRIFDDRIRGVLLRFAIRRIEPDFIHALELQHAGYLTSRALEDKSIETTFIATNYGSDIFWFQQFPKHLVKIKKILIRADRYSAECHRDFALARKYGFTGDAMPVFPNAGGFKSSQLNRKLLLPTQRTVIAIKGYEGWVGRASVAIMALYFLKQELANFKIVIYSCNAKTIRLAKKAKRLTGLDITWHPKGALSHEQMLELFASARIYVGLSLSDGISTSLLEAMAFGAFPIQTNTACVEDWFEHKISGEIVEILEPSLVAKQVSRALLHSATDGSFMELNRRKVIEKAGAKGNLDNSLMFYDLRKK
jgi:glycosyltransferase involved in cell wall biosynthesis